MRLVLKIPECIQAAGVVTLLMYIWSLFVYVTQELRRSKTCKFNEAITYKQGIFLVCSPQLF